MKALIIGSHGYIGKALNKQLIALGHSVTQSQRQDESADYFFDLQQAFDKEKFAKGEVDVVFVLAAITSIKQCQQAKLQGETNHTQATCNLIEYFNQQGCFIVYLSSNHVFADQCGEITIHEQLQPRSIYGEDKAAVEKHLAEKQINAAIVRPTKVIGVEFPLFEQWLECWQKNKVVNAFDDHFIAPVSLENLIQFLIKVATKKVSGRYHCSGEKAYSYYQVANKLAQKMLDLPVTFTPNIQQEKSSALGVIADKHSMLSVQGQEIGYQADTLDYVLTEYIRGKFV